jgi:Mce-associated membrane protein
VAPTTPPTSTTDDSRRSARVTSEAGTRPPEGAAEDDRDDVPAEESTVSLTKDDRAEDGPAEDTGAAEKGRSRSAPRLSLPLVPVLATLLVLLLAAAAFLLLTRPEASAVRTGDYVEALQAARSGVVDLTSFDHMTLDDDIEQIRRVATGDLEDEAIARLEDNREQLTQSEAIVNTEIVGAGVTRANESAATVLLVIQSTQQSNASEQAQVLRYRIEVELTKDDDRWLLAGITGL